MAKEPSLVDSLISLCQGSTMSDKKDEFIKTGSIVFDAVLSNGRGLPRGKFIQLSSDSGLGKTTLALHVCRNLCSQGFICFYIDSEKSVNESQMDSLGLTEFLGKTFFHRSVNTFEETEEVLDKVLVPDDKFALLVIDSITSLLPQKMLDNSVSSVEPGLQARYTSIFLPKYKAKIESSGCPATFLFINQMRTKLNFMRSSTFEAAGGSAQKFNMDIRLMMKQKEKLKKTVSTISGREETPYGCLNYLYSEKNRYNNPFVKAEIAIYFGKGVSNISYYQQFLINNGYVKSHRGGMYDCQLPSMQEAQTIRGVPKYSSFVRDHLEEIKELVENQGGVKLITGDDTE